MGGETSFEIVHHHVIFKALKMASSDFLGVLQFKCSGSGVARVSERRLLFISAFFVKAFKALKRHDDFATHFEEGGIIAVQT